MFEVTDFDQLTIVLVKTQIVIGEEHIDHPPFVEKRRC